MFEKKSPFPPENVLETKMPEEYIFSQQNGIIDLRGKRLDPLQLEALLETVEGNKNIGAVLWGEIASGSEKLKASIEKAIIQNNISYRHHPDDYTHGLLSAAAYEENVIGKPLEKLPNWTAHKIFEDKKSEFYAVVFENIQDNQLVLAYRGLSFSSADLLKKGSTLGTTIHGVIGGSIVAQQAHAFGSTEYAIEMAKQKNYNISVTGHSIGAWLAELSVYYGCWDFKKKIKAVTFDSPGSVPMMQKFKANIESHESTIEIKDFDITAYLSTPNLMNSCNSHVGRKVFRLYPKFEPQGWLKKLQSLPVLGKKIGEAIEPITALAANSLTLMLETFDPISGKPKEYEEVLDWPVLKIDMEEFEKAVVEKAIGLIPYSDYVPSFITSVVAGKIGGFASQYTSISLINLLVNLLNGNIDMEQYVSLFGYLDAEKGHSLREDLKTEEKFSVTYESHYKVRPVVQYKEPLREGQVEDWFIIHLKEYQKRLMASKSLLPVIKQQVELLIGEYEIESFGADKTVNMTNGMSVEALRNRVKRLVDLHKEALTTAIGRARRRSSVEIVGKLMSNLLERPQYFTGREDFFKEASDLFDSRQIVAVSGFGGSGKSTFALEYCYAAKAKGKTVRWLAAESPEKLQIDYKNLAEELGVSTSGEELAKLIRAVNSKLNSLGNILLMFDNVEEYEHIKQYLLNLDDCVKVMITTRHANIARKNWGHIPMVPFTAQESVDYIQSRLGGIKVNELDIKNLRAKIGDLPQRLAIVLGFIADNGLTIADFLELLETDELKSFDEAQAQNLNKAMEIVVGGLIAKDKRSWEMLLHMAYMDADFVPRPLLKELGFSLKEYAQAKKNLESLSLAKEVMQDGIQGFRLHRLVQEDAKAYIKAFYTADIEEEVLHNLKEALYKLFPNVSRSPDETWQEAKLYFASVNAISDRLLEMKDKFAIRILSNIGQYYRFVAVNPKEALKRAQKVLALYESYFPEDEGEVASYSARVAFILIDLEENKEALTYMQKCLAIEEKLYPSNHPQLGRRYEALGTIYNNLKEYDKSLEYFYHALTIWQAAYPEGHPFLADIYLSLAATYKNIDKLDEAIQCCEEALKIRKSCFKGNHLDVANALGKLGDVYDDAGKKELALPYFEESLAMLRVLFPPGRIDLAEILEVIGNIYNSLKKPEQALLYQQEALEIRSAFYQGPHIEIASSWHNIGMAVGQAGNYRESLEAFGKSLMMIQTVAKDNFTKISSRLNFMGRIYYRLEYMEKSVLFCKPQDFKIADFAESFPLYKPDTGPEFAVLEILLKVNAVQKVASLAEGGSWLAETALRGSRWLSCWAGRPVVAAEKSIADYLQDEYLNEVLAHNNTAENINISRCWLFEAINIGIVRSNFVHLALAKEFAQQYESVVLMAAERYPQFFVHKNLVEALKLYHRKTAIIMGTGAEHLESKETFAISIRRDATMPLSMGI